MTTLLDKTAIPRIDVDLLPRTRLWDRLDEALLRRAVVVAAPAGYGKTTTCASWTRQRGSPGRVAWLTLDPGDRVRGRFWEYVRAALGDLVPELPVTDEDAGYELFLSGLVTALAISDEQVTLVLDDSHEIADSAAMNDLDFVLRHAPSTFHLMLVGRQMPGFQVARLRLAGDLDVIASADLACTAQEARDLLRMQGIGLDEAELARLMRLTEGWIGGLRLELLGGDVVAEYVREEFLTAQDRTVRDFLMRTSVADLLTAELADALTSSGESARLLDRLSRERGFVEHVNGERPAFRYHPMIKAVLRAELERELPHEIPALYCALGRWHRRHGHPVDALECAIVAGDREYFCSLLDDDDVGLLTSDAAPDAGRFFLDLSPDYCAGEPSVITAAAIARLRCGDLDGAGVLLAQAERVATGVASDSAQVLRIKHAALRLAMAVQTRTLGPAAQASAWQVAETAVDGSRHPAERRAYGWLTAVLGVTHFARGELRPARHALRLAEREFASAGPAHLHERVGAWLALAEATEGRLRAAKQYAEQVGEESAVADLARAAYVRVLFEEGEPVRAGALLATMRPWPVEPLLGELAPAFVMQALRLAVCLANGDVAGACAAHSRLPEAAGSYADALGPAFVLLDPARTARTLADPADRLDAGAWQGSESPRAIWPTARDLLLARHAVDGNPRAALEIVADCRAREGGQVRLRDAICTLLVSAVANRRLGAGDTAARQLEEALALAEPEGARQVFVEGGNGVRVLLTVALPVESRFAGFRAEILQRFERALVAPDAYEADGGELTESERAVLRFLPSHLTNDEIASDLCLSVNTVKTHLRSIYRKLGVRSRRTAIAAADRRGLVLTLPAESVDRGRLVPNTAYATIAASAVWRPVSAGIPASCAYASPCGTTNAHSASAATRSPRTAVRRSNRVDVVLR